MTVLLIVIYLVFISLGLPDSLFGVAWPVVHREFGLEESFASLYGIIIGVCTGGVSNIAGPLLRKFGTARVTFVSTLLTIIGLLAMSFAPNIVVMMIFAVILGYGGGVIDTGLNNYVSLHYKAQHMNWLHCFWGVGVTISPMVMSLFLEGEGSGWRNGYRVVALLQSLIAFAVLVSLPKWKKTEKSQIAAVQPDEQQAKFSLKEIFTKKGVVTSILSVGFYCAMEFMLGTWGATYAVNVYNFTPDDAAKWVSLYYGGIMLGRMLAGFIAIKVDDDTLIKCGVVVSILGVVMLFLPIGNASLVGYLLIGTGFGPVFPCILHSIPSRFGGQFSADITGYHMFAGYGIGFGIQLIYAFVATSTTFKITPFVLMALCLILFATQLYTEKTIKKAKG